jgi:hypothetical protein
LQDPPKIYPNLDFWFENMRSGNPDSRRPKKKIGFCALLRDAEKSASMYIEKSITFVHRGCQIFADTTYQKSKNKQMTTQYSK